MKTMEIMAFPNEIIGSEVQKHLLGHNIEHTRGAIFQGLSAQLLRNRKFAGKPARKGAPAQWFRVGSPQAFFTLDPIDSYVKHYEGPEKSLYGNNNETNGLAIQNPVEGRLAGIGQSELAIRKGEKYDFCIVCANKMAFAVVLDISFTTEDKILHEQGITLSPQSNWEKHEFTFLGSETTSNATLKITYKQQAHIVLGVCSLIPSDTFLGMRVDAIACLKEIGAPLLRWPGGNFSGEYRWKDGLLDRDVRAPLLSFMPIETQPFSGGFDDHEIGIDEFIALCREVDADPYITINLNWDSPEESAQFLEYCNGSKETRWGSVRASRGYEEPYNVKFWSLGNEFGHGHMEGLNSPKYYLTKAQDTARAMKKVDPTIEFFASGPYTPEREYSSWTDETLPLLAEYISYISYHAYQWSYVHGLDIVTAEGIKRTYYDIIKAPEFWISDLRALRKNLDKKGGAIANLQIAFDEWNTFFAWYHSPSVMEGMFTAVMIDMLFKEYQALKMPVCMYFQPLNEGAIEISPFHSELTAMGQVFKVMKNHLSGIPFKIDDSSKSSLRCFGTIHPNKGVGIITAVHTAYDEEAHIRLTGIEFKDARVTLLRGQNIHIPGSLFVIEDIGDFIDTVILPPHSIVQVKYSL
nr:hypothetical protein [uncultured Sphaerochaeta sp.]